MVTAEYLVNSRQVLSPNPSASAIDACLGPHQGYLLDTALVWPPEPPLPPPLPLPPLPLLHAATARDTTATAEAPVIRRGRRLPRMALPVVFCLICSHSSMCAASSRQL